MKSKAQQLAEFREKFPLRTVFWEILATRLLQLESWLSTALDEAEERGKNQHNPTQGEEKE